MEAMAVRQNWSDDRIDGLERKVDEGFRHVDDRFALVDKRFEQVDKRFDEVDKRFDQIDRRFDQIDRRFERMGGESVVLRGDMNTRFESLEARFDFRMGTFEDGLRGFHRMLMVLCIALFASFTGLIGTFLTIMLTQL
jgi:tetrahydromethanopterin S-methyltransferase subunit G